MNSWLDGTASWMNPRCGDWLQREPLGGAERHCWLWGFMERLSLEGVVALPFMGGKQMPDKECDFFLKVPEYSLYCPNWDTFESERRRPAGSWDHRTVSGSWDVWGQTPNS